MKVGRNVAILQLDYQWEKSTMTQLPSEVVSQIFALPPAQRYALAQKLWESVDDNSLVIEWEQELVAEIDRRMERYHRGETQAIEWNAAAEEAFRSEVRQRLGK